MTRPTDPRDTLREKLADIQTKPLNGATVIGLTMEEMEALIRSEQLALLDRLENTPGGNMDDESDFAQLLWAIAAERTRIEGGEK